MQQQPPTTVGGGCIVALSMQDRAVVSVRVDERTPEVGKTHALGTLEVPFVFVIGMSMRHSATDSSSNEGD